jgi:phosphoglycerol transferase MdoB-like AlkP superfamily enzyme
MNAKGFPLLPEDFQLASEVESLSKFIDFGALFRTILAAILAVGLFSWYERGVRGYFKITKEKLGGFKERILVRGLLVLVSIGIFIPATDFIRNHQGMRREDVGWLDAQFVAWNQVENYERNGFIIGFLYNLQSMKLEEPEGYSEEKIEEVKNELKALSVTTGCYSIDQSCNYFNGKMNVIVVLNESFYDPEIISEYYPYEGGEILPNLHRVQKEYPSGTMYSQDIGGGTANIEFEILTGLSNYWSNSVPYTDVLSKKGATPSLASHFRDLGFETTAIHPFNGSMYKRDIVLKNFGFERFITKEDMPDAELEGGSEYIKDSEAYAEVVKVLRGGESGQFVTLITMQNHMPYAEINYEARDFKSLRDDLSDEERAKIETYYQTLHTSDAYLGEFLAELDEVDEPTAVLFFGDHSTGLFRDVSESENKEVRNLSRMTPYFVYANFDLENEGGGAANLPMATPNCLPNTFLNTLGAANKPDLFYLLDEVCAETPILSRFYYGDDAPKETAALRNYELINYDLLGGKRYFIRD